MKTQNWKVSKLKIILKFKVATMENCVPVIKQLLIFFQRFSVFTVSE